jgi:hypothetical protein
MWIETLWASDALISPRLHAFPADRISIESDPTKRRHMIATMVKSGKS